MSTHGHAVISVHPARVLARLDGVAASFTYGPASLDPFTKGPKEHTVWAAIKKARSWAWRRGAASGEIHHHGIKTTF